MPAITFDHLTHVWPDGSPALKEISGSFGPERTGLVGRNGVGKTTLLRLLAGGLSPTSGSIDMDGDVAYLPQNLPLDSSHRVVELLGVADAYDAVRAIEAGDVSPARFDAVGDDWDVESRSQALLASAALDPSLLGRTVGELSGGEAMRVALAGLRSSGAEVTLLDEPTNNLDIDARRGVYELIQGWPGALVVVSHDVELLESMDAIAELYDHGLTTFGGPYSQWREWKEAEQKSAQQAVVDAKKDFAKEKRQRIESEAKLARRSRYAKTDYENKRRPRAVMKRRAREAQVSAGKLRGQVRQSEAAAGDALEMAQDRVRDDPTVAIDLPDPGIAASRRIATFGDGTRIWIVEGPERIALTGPNGTGKTTLLASLLGQLDAGDRSDIAAGIRLSSTLHVDRVAFLPQNIAFDDGATPLGLVRSVASNVPDRELTNRLARFLVRGNAMRRPVADLSGGERFRVALASLLLADPPPQLLVLDEPTNNLDLETRNQLLQALRSYRGAVLIVSHDGPFIEELEPDLVLEMCDGSLAERRT